MLKAATFLLCIVCILSCTCGFVINIATTQIPVWLKWFLIIFWLALIGSGFYVVFELKEGKS